VRLVLDASTAILLAKVGILRRVVEKTTVGIGRIAATEALRKQSDDAVAIAILIEEGKLRQLSETEGVNALSRDFRLHAGEAEAIALARRSDAVCGTDDARAIRCCKALGIRFTTAIGLLVAMTEAGELDTGRAFEVLLQLERFGRYKPRILEDAASRIRAARAVGET
jgi:predicted nucleic acid-binding protein